MAFLIERVKKYRDHLLHMIISLKLKEKIGRKAAEPILEMNKLRKVNTA